jgi:hypothetical protein
LGQVFDPTLEQIRRFGREEVVKPIFELSVVVEGNSGQIVGERAEEVVIRWGKVRRVERMWKNLPFEFPNGRLRHVCSVWSGVVMLKNHSMSSTRACLLDCFLQTAKLLTIAFSSDGQISLRQFVMGNPLHIPPDAQHYLARLKIRLPTGCCLFVWAQPFLPLLEIDVEAPFSVASDNVGQKILMMMSELRSTDGER